MTYGEIKRESLRLINCDTVAGQEIPAGYNCQADLLAAIPSLVDSAQADIALRVKMPSAIRQISTLPRRVHGKFTIYDLPEDCREPICILDGGTVEPWCDVVLRGGGLVLPDAAPEGLLLEYRRLPVSVGSEPDEGQQLDGSPDTHSAIPYFVAAQLVLYDDSYRYAALRNEYEIRIASLRERPRIECVSVADVYGFQTGVL